MDFPIKIHKKNPHIADADTGNGEVAAHSHRTEYAIKNIIYY